MRTSSPASCKSLPPASATARGGSRAGAGRAQTHPWRAWRGSPPFALRPSIAMAAPARAATPPAHGAWQHSHRPAAHRARRAMRLQWSGRRQRSACLPAPHANPKTATLGLRGWMHLQPLPRGCPPRCRDDQTPTTPAGRPAAARWAASQAEWPAERQADARAVRPAHRVETLTWFKPIDAARQVH